MSAAGPKCDRSPGHGGSWPRRRLAFDSRVPTRDRGSQQPNHQHWPDVGGPRHSRRFALTRAEVVAISPLIGGQAFSGPAAKLMEACGYEVSPAGVARCYHDFLDNIVIDVRIARWHRRFDTRRSEYKLPIFKCPMMKPPNGWRSSLWIWKTRNE